jgi:large subunit ribosomal protein L9e
MFLTEEEGRKVLKVDCHFGKRKALASIRTCTSHVQVRQGGDGERRAC